MYGARAHKIMNSKIGFSYNFLEFKIKVWTANRSYLEKLALVSISIKNIYKVLKVLCL
jgi:hypothetical protein